jgi:tetratricopeptide (TPR) repeat protein
MGKVIFTKGNYSPNPYWLKNSKLSIRSAEELVFCIRKNPELCEDFLYDKELAAYISDELGLKETGSLLTDLIERDAPLKDLISVCFTSNDYLEKDEIEEFISELSKVERSEEWVRIRNKADSYLDHENYKNAVINYRNLTKEAENLKITTETLGDIYHNMGVAMLHTEGFLSAADCFREAYERNNREESMRDYLLALKFSGNDAEYRSALDIYGISEETTTWLNTAFFHTELEADAEPELFELEEAVKLLRSGKVNEFYAIINKMTGRLKEQYRKYNE